MKRFWIANVVAAVALSTVVACESPDKERLPAIYDDVDTDKNEWIFDYNNVGPLASKIWGIFIDTRQMDLWQLYLSPVTNIEFEEVFDYTPVKITIPVDFPLDGSNVRFSADDEIRVEYVSVVWDASNAPNGFLRARYDSSSGNFEITFATGDRLKGHYRGPLTIIE